MSRHVLIFCVCVVLGALITLVIRVSRHHPYQEMPAPAVSQ